MTPIEFLFASLCGIFACMVAVHFYNFSEKEKMLTAKGTILIRITTLLFAAIVLFSAALMFSSGMVIR